MDGRPPADVPWQRGQKYIARCCVGGPTNSMRISVRQRRQGCGGRTDRWSDGPRRSPLSTGQPGRSGTRASAAPAWRPVRVAAPKADAATEPVGRRAKAPRRPHGAESRGWSGQGRRPAGVRGAEVGDGAVRVEDRRRRSRPRCPTRVLLIAAADRPAPSRHRARTSAVATAARRIWLAGGRDERPPSRTAPGAVHAQAGCGWLQPESRRCGRCAAARRLNVSAPVRSGVESPGQRRSHSVSLRPANTWVQPGRGAPERCRPRGIDRGSPLRRRGPSSEEPSNAYVGVASMATACRARTDDQVPNQNCSGRGARTTSYNGLGIEASRRCACVSALSLLDMWVIF